MEWTKKSLQLHGKFLNANTGSVFRGHNKSKWSKYIMIWL